MIGRFLVPARSPEARRPRGVVPRVLACVALLAAPDGPAASGADGPALASEPSFRVQLTDGRTLRGRIRAIGPGGTLALEGSETGDLPLERAVSLSRTDAVPSAGGEGSIVLLPDGDRLRGVVGAGEDDQLRLIATGLGETAVSVPLTAMQGVVLAPSGDAEAWWRLVRRVRQEKRDGEVLWLANGDRLAGSLLGIGRDKIEFQGDAGAVSVPRGTVEAIGFDPALVRYPRPDSTYLEVTLLDGSRLGVSGARTERGQIVAQTRFGTEVRIGLARVARVHVRGDSVAYLSERPETAAQYLGYLGEHPGVYGRDTTWDGHPLRLGGEPFDRGLGMLPRTLLAYRLDPADLRFQATAGLDERAGPLGSVVFRVLVDGRERFNSGPLTPGRAPVAVDVDVSGGRTLILDTEFGERGDVHDQADWAEARLVR